MSELKAFAEVIATLSMPALLTVVVVAMCWAFKRDKKNNGSNSSKGNASSSSSKASDNGSCPGATLIKRGQTDEQARNRLERIENATLRGCANSRVSARANKHSTLITEAIAKQQGVEQTELDEIQDRMDSDSSGVFKNIDEQFPIE